MHQHCVRVLTPCALCSSVPLALSLVPDSSYPKKFHAICSTIYKRFFRIYAHIYHSHFKEIQALGADAHVRERRGEKGTSMQCAATREATVRC